MLLYLIGLTLVAYGIERLRKDVDSPFPELERLSGISLSTAPPLLRKLVLFGRISAIVFFVWGFFVFKWYVPLLGLWVLPAMLTLSFYSRIQSQNLYVLAKEQIGIDFGAGMCLLGLLSSK